MPDSPRAPRRPVLLVLRALKLGDLLVAVPAIRGLRRAHPGHRLVLAVPGWLEPIVRQIGGVDELLPTPGLDEPLAPVGPVDVAVNLHGRGPQSSTRIAELEARWVIAHRGEGSGDGAPEWRDGIHERERWVRLVSAFGIPADPGDLRLPTPGPTPRPSATVIHAGAFHGARHWPTDRFAAVARALRADGADVVVTGSVDEAPRAAEVARRAGLPDEAMLAGRLDLGEFAALIASARLLVSADTGAAHLASAYGIPSVVLFGPAPADEWGPPPGPHRALEHPEHRRGDVFAVDPDPALLAIGVDEVLAAIREVTA